MSVILLLSAMQPRMIDNTADYITGAVIALFIFIYLIYALIRPEKF